MRPAFVELEGDDPSGLAEMLATLIGQNLAREPSRLAHLRPSVIVLAATDAEVVVTLRLDEGVVRVCDGASGEAHLRIAAAADRLLALTTAPLLAGLPDPLRPRGRAVLADVLTGRVHVRGLLRHPIRLARFAALLSVHERESPRSGTGGHRG